MSGGVTLAGGAALGGLSLLLGGSVMSIGMIGLPGTGSTRMGLVPGVSIVIGGCSLLGGVAGVAGIAGVAGVVVVGEPGD